MIIYLCPTDKKYACSWEGSAEDILPHFEQEHDDLLHYNDFFEISLNVSSENRLFFIDEEIYLAQIRISENLLKIYLRYLGPSRIASQLSYNIILKANYELCSSNCIFVSEQGCINIDLSRIEDLEEISYLQCTLNITRTDNDIHSDDDVFVQESLEYGDMNEKLPYMPLPRQLNIEEDNEIVSNSNENIRPTTTMGVQLSRSKTVNSEDYRKRIIKRCKSTVSLGAINEIEFSENCSNCGLILSPPIYLCPCGQSFCSKCQTETCRLCTEKVTFERNTELEQNFTKYLLPCKYRTSGCPDKLVYTELNNHENNCVFCEYKCPMEECGFEGQFKHMCKHLKLIHGSTRMLESFIVVFQNIPEAFLINEEKGIFYCHVQYFNESVLWQAKFCGPKERRFFCELKFKEGKLKKPLLLTRTGNTYSVQITLQDLKKMKLKPKYAILTITS